MLVALLTIALISASQSDPRSTLRVQVVPLRARHTPKIDGRLDEAEWSEAKPTTPFVQRYPEPNEQASESTGLRVLYDDTSLYVGLDCTQLHSPIVKRLGRRDSQLPSDSVWIDIDSRLDGHTAFHFGVNAAGVLNDGIYSTDTDYSADWDGIWEARVADTDHGYSVEFRIPLKTLRFQTAAQETLGLQVGRFIDARQETDYWSSYPRGATAYIPFFGLIEGLATVASTGSLEVAPFLLGRARRRTNDFSADGSTEPGLGGTQLSWSAGLDARLHLTESLTLNLTLNPDFGQVEVDTLTLNLSTIETFFPEKRPFFLEGTELFTTPQPVLYTRRIGQQPTPLFAPSEFLFGIPDPSPVYGATKLVGTLARRTTLGVLTALTGPTTVAVQTSDGTVVARHDPLSTYAILRLTQQVTDHFVLGALTTAVNRFEGGSPPVPCTGTATLPAPATASARCFNDAYTASTDGTWRSSSSNYYATGQVVGTVLNQGPVRAERDGIPIRPGTISGLGTLLLGKDGGTHWFYNTGQLVSGREYETNDAGYNDRKNEYQSYYSVSYRTLARWWRTVETRTRLQLDMHRTLDGIDLGTSLGLTTQWTFDSFWLVALNVHRSFDHFDDREMGDGTALERAGGPGSSLSITSDPRKMIVGSLYADGDRLKNGVHFEMHGRLTLRVSPALELGLLPTGTYDGGAPRYIATLSDSLLTQPTAAAAPETYLLGVQDARSIGISAQLTYSLSPALSLEVFAQVFLVRIHYSRFFEGYETAPRQKLRLDELQSAPPPAVDYDEQAAAFNMNAVVRWEYRLGSTVYLVYSRSQNPLVDASTTTLTLRPILQGKAAVDVLMLKFVYWWG